MDGNTDGWKALEQVRSMRKEILGTTGVCFLLELSGEKKENIQSQLIISLVTGTKLENMKET